jgi:rhodanese-related sulfurtransferase
MKFSSRIYIVASIIIFVGLFYYFYDYAVNSRYRISSQEAKRRLKAKQVDLILDVRTDLERATLGSYPGSVHIESADLDEQMPARFPNKGIKILAYCNTGHRARLATEKLQTLGYKDSVYISSSYTTLY